MTAPPLQEREGENCEGGGGEGGESGSTVESGERERRHVIVVAVAVVVVVVVVVPRFDHAGRYILLCSLVHLLGRRREKELSLVWNRYFPYKSHLKMGKIFGNP